MPHHHWLMRILVQHTWPTAAAVGTNSSRSHIQGHMLALLMMSCLRVHQLLLKSNSNSSSSSLLCHSWMSCAC